MLNTQTSILSYEKHENFLFYIQHLTQLKCMTLALYLQIQKITINAERKFVILYLNEL